MKLLLMSNGYPSVEQPFGSIYVKNHFERLQEYSNILVDKHVIVRKNTNIFGSIFKYLYSVVCFLGKLHKSYDVIHVHFLSPLYILACLYKIRNPTCKIVMTFHGSDINLLKNKVLISIYSYLLRYSDTIISVSDILKAKAEHKLNIDVDYVIPAGFNDNIFNCDEKSMLKRNIDFLFVGSFLPIKGLETLIDAIHLLNNTEINFVFVGTGDLKSHLMHLNNKFDVDVIDGLPQHELNKIYNNAKVFILPSYNEGFNISLLEANYCGVPAIVRNIAALRNQVTHGINGYLFNNAEDLASLIQFYSSIENDEWCKLSKNSRLYASDYSLSRVIDLMVNIYKAKSDKY